MAINLNKGDKFSFDKVPNLSKLYLGIGWELVGTGVDIDLVIGSVDANNQGLDVVFYNQKESSGGAIKLSGDNLTGKGDGDDEFCLIKLKELPQKVAKIFICLNIHQADSRGQSFASLKEATFHIVDADNKVELANADIDNDFGQFTAVNLAVLTRVGDNWDLQLTNKGVSGNIIEMFSQLGLSS